MTRYAPDAPVDVSVVVPAYQAARFIQATLRSILSQTVNAIEVIVVDDGSTDETAARVSEIEDDRLHLIRQENAGVAVARTRGSERARGAWIAWCDADDLWRPRKLELQLAALDEAPESVAAFCGVVQIDAEGGVLERVPAPESRSVGLIDVLRHRGGEFPPLPASCALVPREVVGRVGPWNPAFQDAADWEYLIRLRREGPFCGVAEPLVEYRIHDAQMSRGVRRRVRELERLFRMLRREGAEDVEGARAVEKAWAWNAWVGIASLYRGGFPAAAASLAARSILRNPVAVLRGFGAWRRRSGQLSRVEPSQRTEAE